MGIPLVLAALILGIAAYRDAIEYLGTNLEQDFKGFLPWLAAIAAIGALGLIPKARVPAHALLALVFLVLFISNKGIFANIQNITSSIKSPPASGGVATVKEGTVTGSTSTVSTPQVTNPDSIPLTQPTSAEKNAINDPAFGNVIRFPSVPNLLGTGSF